MTAIWSCSVHVPPLFTTKSRRTSCHTVSESMMTPSISKTTAWMLMLLPDEVGPGADVPAPSNPDHDAQYRACSHPSLRPNMEGERGSLERWP